MGHKEEIIQQFEDMLYEKIYSEELKVGPVRLDQPTQRHLEERVRSLAENYVGSALSQLKQRVEIKKKSGDEHLRGAMNQYAVHILEKLGLCEWVLYNLENSEFGPVKGDEIIYRGKFSGLPKVKEYGLSELRLQRHYLDATPEEFPKYMKYITEVGSPEQVLTSKAFEVYDVLFGESD